MRTISLSQLDSLIDIAFKANVPLGLVGDPGVAKTAKVNAYGARLGIPVSHLELAQCDPSDVGGIPVNVNGAIVRLPVGPIKACCDAPGILFLDEYSQAIPAIQGASLTLLNERRAGDFKLHPDSRIILAWNPPDSGANANDLAPPAINRLIAVKVVPTIAEVSGYLETLGADGSTLRMLGADYAATVEASPGLIQLSPPAGKVGCTWASPRAIVNGLKAFAAALDFNGGNDRDPVGIALLAGAVGDEVADAYMAIRAIRDRLANRSEILADPEHARLPSGIDAGIASLGVIAQVAQEDSACAWIFADRLDPETRAAAGRSLTRYQIGKNKRKEQAEKARARILGSTGARLARAG